MDSKDNFLIELKDFLFAVDEEYLISISNKGTYKRTLKDMEGGLKVEIKLMEGFINTSLSDGSECTITSDISTMKCSCPSRSVCKHIIASLIYLKDNINQDSTEEEKKSFDEVLDYSTEKILKNIGHKNFKEILYRMQYGIKAEFTEDNFLTISFKEEDIDVRFPHKNAISQSICTCRETEFCNHRGEAILQYKVHKGVISAEELIKASNIKIEEETLEQIKKTIEDIVVVGLSRLPNSINDKLQRLSLMCQSEGLASLQKLLRALNNELDLYFSRNAAFTRKRALGLCSKLYNLCDAIKKADTEQLEDLIGEQRSLYFKVPPVILQSIAAENWITQSGYEGITLYFWSSERQQWFTYTRAQANYYEKTAFNAEKVYYSKLPWETKNTFKDLEGKSIRLDNLRINKNRRITSSEDVKLEIIQEEAIVNLLESSKFNDISSKLLKQTEEIFGKQDENYNLFMVKPKSLGNGTFDEIKQVLELPMVDSEDNTMVLTVKYSERNKRIIEKLERRTQDIEGFFVRAYLEYGVLKAFPITVFYSGGRLLNLTLD
ncbi:MAG: hypothetical protein Q8936_17905 [Bacillota bacterium]|nr:hypothetical protein [Bacillota bacterium]